MSRTARPPRRAAFSLTVAAATLALAALGTPPVRAAGNAPLTLYSAQHEQVVASIVQAFTAKTGIPVRVRSGEGPEIANQISQEGAQSPADVYFTENSPELMLLDEKGLLAHVDRSTLAAVPRRYSAPNGDWVGVLARENVLVYDTKLISANQLPHSLMDLAQPAWKGRIAFAPSDADFLPLVDAVAALKGKPAALAWLQGLRANGKVFDDDEGVVAAVDRGSVPVGIINSYYWARPHARDAKSASSQIVHFAPGDVGGLVNVSGAAVLKSSQHQAEAQQFLAFLVSKPVQAMLGKSDVDFEYPLAPGVAANALLAPLRELHPPKISLAQLGDDREAAQLLRQAGLI